MPLTFAPDTPDALPLTLLSPETLDGWIDTQEDAVKAWVLGNGFRAGSGKVLLLPGAHGAPGGALIGLGDGSDRSRERFALASAAGALPEGDWRLDGTLSGAELEEAALGWLFAGYAFGRYRKKSGAKARLVAPAGVDAARLEAIAAGEALVRDLINTPASDMGPSALAAAAEAVAQGFGATFRVVTGEELLAQNFPMIHAVGRAAEDAPRLIEMTWGEEGPALTLVGKGVCFDTGGLDIKPSSNMLLMKKDMGGAGNVLGLASMIMDAKLPIRLRVLIPAVENSISANAFRPSDILTSRKGKTVEIGNTDAEGRLVLADALALGDEEAPELMIDMATLTGAARVALGPDLPAFFTDDEALASGLAETGSKVADPIWRLPLWKPYNADLASKVADTNNVSTGGFGGAITAALFLQGFVEKAKSWGHFDIYGWRPKASPIGPVGGEAMAIRTLFEHFSTRYPAK